MTSHPEYNRRTNGTDAAKAFADQIRGRTILITGTSPKGLGQATAHAIVANGPRLLIISGRSTAKMDEVAAGLRKSTPSVEVRTLIMDLSSQKSIHAAAAEVNAYPEDIDVLINNAGIMPSSERTLTEDGIEMTFGTNHVGHFLFTRLILGKLQAAAAAKGNKPSVTRIINLSSFGHNFSPVRFSDHNFDGEPIPPEEETDWDLVSEEMKLESPKDGYSAWGAYGQSKSANVLFSLSLNKRLAGQGIVSLALHPGTIKTKLSRNMSGERLAPLLKALDPSTFKTLDQGVSTTIVAAFDPKLDGKEGSYLDDCQLALPASWAASEANADKLWDLSEKLVGHHFKL